MCISLGHLNRGVAHPFHDCSYVYTCAQQSGATGMSQHVYDELVVIPQPYGITHLYPITVEPALCYVRKDPVFICSTGSIAGQKNSLNTRCHLHSARLVRLGFPQSDAACLDVNVAKAQRECLAFTGTCINVEAEQI